MEREKKFMIIGMFILLISLVGSAGTYAWFTWSSASNTNLTMSIGESSDVVFKKGNTISTNKLAPVFNYIDGESTSFTITNKSNTSFKYKVLLNIASIADELKNSTLKYKLVSNNTIITEGDFSNIESTNKLYEGELAKGNVSYIFYLYIDGNEENNLNMVDKSLSGTITVEEVKETAVTMLSAKFKAAVKAQITNNNVTYNYDTSNNLMEDVGGNLRYYGADPRNYIYFNCEDYSNQTSSTCELWRIIGIFDGKMKIMRNESIGNMPFDDDDEDTYFQKLFNEGKTPPTVKLTKYVIGTRTNAKSIWFETKGQNDYSKSLLQKILNNYYYNNLTYTGSNTYDFTGLKNDTTRNIVAEVTYNLGGSSAYDYSDEVYESERATTVFSDNATIWIGKLAIPYASDYGYAVDLGLCQKTLDSYSNATCTANNWMENSIISNITSDYVWLLTTESASNHNFYIRSGNGGVSDKNINPDEVNAILPVLYLNSELVIGLGTGTSSDPYQIIID